MNPVAGLNMVLASTVSMGPDLSGWGGSQIRRQP